MDVGKEFDQWVETGRDESMEKGHFEATMQLLHCISSSMNSSPISDSPSFYNKIALDVGCGNGWALRKFIDLGGRFGYGCDLSSKMIEKAKQYNSHNLEYRVGDVGIFSNDLEIQIKELDLCLCIESLYYHPDPQESLRIFYNILNVGGYVGIMVDLYKESWGTHPWIDALDVDVHLLSIMEYKQILECAGFTNIQHIQFQMTSPITREEDFTLGPYWPTYEHYKSYRNTGSLLLFAQKS